MPPDRGAELRLPFRAPDLAGFPAPVTSYKLGNVLPLPGGIGGVEPLMLGIFVASGVDSGVAAAAIVCYRAIALGLQSVTGLVSVASLVPAVRRERREAIGRADLGGLGSAPAPKAVTEIRPTAADPWPSRSYVPGAASVCDL